MHLILLEDSSESLLTSSLIKMLSSSIISLLTSRISKNKSSNDMFKCIASLFKTFICLCLDFPVSSSEYIALGNAGSF